MDKIFFCQTAKRNDVKLWQIRQGNCLEDETSSKMLSYYNVVVAVQSLQIRKQALMHSQGGDQRAPASDVIRGESRGEAGLDLIVTVKKPRPGLDINKWASAWESIARQPGAQRGPFDLNLSLVSKYVWLWQVIKEMGSDTAASYLVSWGWITQAYSYMSCTERKSGFTFCNSAPIGSPYLVGNQSHR